MEEQFLNYDQALALKELGFNGMCFGFYDISSQGGKFYHEKLYVIPDWINLSDSACLAPLYQQAFRWFRDVHNLDVEITPGGKTKKYTIFIKEYLYNDDGRIAIYSYEEAEQISISKLIELVKNK